MPFAVTALVEFVPSEILTLTVSADWEVAPSVTEVATDDLFAMLT